MTTRIINDDRGLTYIHATLTDGTRVQYWWNRYERSWVVQHTDAEGCQLGSSEYCGTKDWALDVADQFVDRYQTAICQREFFARKAKQIRAYDRANTPKRSRAATR